MRRNSADGGAGRPLAIPGARPGAADEAAWAIHVGSSTGGESVGVPPSMGEGLFGSSLRRQSELGYGSSLGRSHGAWLSSSLGHGGGLRVSGAQRPPLHRSPSIGRQPSFLGTHDEEHEEHTATAAAAAAAAAQAEAGGGGGGGGTGFTPRTSLDAALSPRGSVGQHRPQRWHIGGAQAEAGGAAGAGEGLQEPLLSGELGSEASYPLPSTPLHGKGGAAGGGGGPGPFSPAAAATGGGPDAAGAGAGAGAAYNAGGAAAAAAASRAGAGAAAVTVERSLQEAAAEQGGGSTDLSRALVFGLINSVATIPSLVAYAAIVFKNPLYSPYLDQLCKFFFLSSAVHQTVFCLLSTLPFSVGQVQDVGLIFLSAMATSVAGICLEAGRDADTALGTSLLTMSIATFFTGAMTLLVAHFKLAQLVQYLPLPVIGGYLSFVGYFCVASGIGLGVSQDIGSIASWANLLNADALIKLVPTVASCAAMILTLERFSHPLALPTVLLLINLAFHAVRLVLGVTLEQAMDAHWVIRPAPGEQHFWELWGLFNISDWSLSGIYFPAITEQVVKILGLALVVIFGSAMDIAAIQQDTPNKIDFNRELVTVAVSNMATGAAGCGYTGSYIFSQTIFTMRAGVFNRWNGVVVALSEYVMFALPFPVVQYMPNFFFGALLLWFGIEISRDWLILSFSKMTHIEYCLLLATFGAIMQWGLEGGILAGIILATLYFAAAYAKSQVASIGDASSVRSSVVRTVEQQAALDMLGGRLACINLSGFVFFGSANTIGQRLGEEAERLGGSREAEGGGGAEQAAEVEEAIVTSLRTMGESYVGVKHTQAVAALTAAPAYLVLDFSQVRGLDATGARTMGVVHSDLAQHGVVLVVTAADHHGIRPLLQAHGVPLPPQPVHWPPEMAQPRAADAPPSVRGSQAGSPRVSRPSSPLGGSLAAEQPWGGVGYPGGYAVGYPGEEDAADGGILPSLQPSCLEFATLEQGLRFCEDQLLEVAVRYGLCQPPSALLQLEDMLASHLSKLPLGGLDPAGAAHALRRYMSVVSLSAGQLLWKVDDPADELFIIEKGTVRVDEFVHRPVDADDKASARAAAAAAAAAAAKKEHAEGEEQARSLPGGPASPAAGTAGTTARQVRRASDALRSGSAASLPDRSGSGHRVLARSYECGPGCVVGSTDFYLARPHGTRGVCRSPVARVLRVTRAAMERMALEVPQALNVLQLSVMRANTLDLAQAAAQVQAR